MISKTSVVYEPRGKAGEYSRLAVNLYSGCGHRCKYCYAPACTFKAWNVFSMPVPRNGIIERIQNDALNLAINHDAGPVLLCFTCDPYQPIDNRFCLTRQAIQTLHASKVNVMVLTKGGQRAERDFDLLTENDWFGVTLTTLDKTSSIEWEPGAALPDARIQSLIKAHAKGIKTWVSLEPVLYPDVALEIVKQTHTFVDKFKVGTLNYHPHAKSIDWHKFALNIKELLESLNCDYYIKEDLRKWLKV
jgi:DNA repair photolyase